MGRKPSMPSGRGTNGVVPPLRKIVDELVESDAQPEHEAEEAELDQDAERLDITG